MAEPFAAPPLCHSGDNTNPAMAPVLWAKWIVTPRASITVNIYRDGARIKNAFVVIDDVPEWIDAPSLDLLHATWRAIEGCYP